MAITLKLPDPIEVKLSSLGTILLARWDRSSIDAANKITALKNGDSRIFMEEFILALGRKHDVTIKNKNEAYKYGEKIENVSEISDNELEELAKKYIETEKDNLISIILNSDEDIESLIERNKNLREPLHAETSAEHLRRLVIASLEAEREQNKKFLDNFPI